MKKITFVALALALIAIPSCKNNNKQEEKQVEEKTQQEILLEEELKINLESFTESTKRVKNLPFERGKDGQYALTAKDKMVKPDYLLSPDCANGLVTLSQKYRAISMLIVDKVIADLYDMPITDYKNAIINLTIDINDNAYTQFAQSDEPVGDKLSALYEKEAETGRTMFFWESVASSLVEQIYIATRDIDRFCSMFDDQTASDVTYNFVLLHEGLSSIVAINPEMEALNTAIEPLYVINAINVEQLKSQLTELKGEIEVIREYLLK